MRSRHVADYLRQMWIYFVLWKRLYLQMILSLLNGNLFEKPYENPRTGNDMTIDFVENLEVVAGDTLTVDLELLDEDSLPVTDLVGASAVMEIRENVLDVTLDASATAVINTTDALVQFTIPGSVTETWLGATDIKKVFRYGCRITYSDNTIRTILGGKIMVNRGVVE